MDRTVFQTDDLGPHVCVSNRAIIPLHEDLISIS
jgi:hypothetical protein